MDLGGAETLIMNWYRNIDRKKLQFDFLCHNRTEAKYSKEILSLGGRMYCIPGMSHGGPLKYQNNLYAFFSSHKEYMVVHSHMNELNGIILKQAQKAGIPNRYTHMHTVFTNVSLEKKILLMICKKNINRYTTRAFSCSRAAGEQLYRKELLKTFTVISNGINVENFRYHETVAAAVREELGIGNGPVIGHVGRFAPVKNHAFILHCFKGFLDLYPEAKLILIGEGELNERIKIDADEMGISDSVLSLGTRTDVNRLMNAMDLFLFPSIKEGLPVSVIEAQAAGLGVLISDAISDETMLTDLIRQKSLSDPPIEWAHELSAMYKLKGSYDRSVYPEQIREKGFDARAGAEMMSRIYLSDASDAEMRK